MCGRGAAGYLGPGSRTSARWAGGRQGRGRQEPGGEMVVSIGDALSSLSPRGEGRRCDWPAGAKQGIESPKFYPRRSAAVQVRASEGGVKEQTSGGRCPWPPPEFRSPVGLKIQKDKTLQNCFPARRQEMKLHAMLH